MKKQLNQFVRRCNSSSLRIVRGRLVRFCQAVNCIIIGWVMNHPVWYLPEIGGGSLISGVGR